MTRKYILTGDLLIAGKVEVEASSAEDAVEAAARGEFTVYDEVRKDMGFQWNGDEVLDRETGEVIQPASSSEPDVGNSRCQNCGWQGPDDQLQPIKNIFERVAPGEPMPSGECPECGCLCQPVPDRCDKCNR